MVLIREIRKSDAEKFLSLCHQLDRETQFMLLEPGERVISVEEQRERINGILASHNQTILVAEDQQGQLTGYLSAIGGSYNRNRRTTYLVIGICWAGNWGPIIHSGGKVGASTFHPPLRVDRYGAQ